MSIELAKMTIPALGALSVLSAMIVNENSTQMGLENGKTISAFLFVAGWLIAAYSVGNGMDMMAWAGAAMIVAATWYTKMYKSANPSMYESEDTISGELMSDAEMYGGAIIFIAGWLLFAYSIGKDKYDSTLWYSLGGAILILLSTLWVMPKEKKSGVCNGFGSLLYMVGWLGIVYSIVM